ncbi:Hypothetical protein SMAX5B_012263 [Scophthalmus maximus]|uniref:Uncharacterized protein n=1 Tax=Scophthalmus maximus TaxID=52904 RepID=A0A2U9B6M6_SCOMX|nr:Hypothetical protein SMAX5B_012247 [Scophthalmus maximus]AWO99588.1 Hypothetical protein SMAX5B_012263 [Scophthalmus maximus]
MSALPLMWKGAVNVELWPQERVFMSLVNHTEPLNVSAQQHPQGRLERLALLPLKVLNMLANLTNEISPLALVVMSLERYGARAPVPPVLSSEGVDQDSGLALRHRPRVHLCVFVTCLS